MGSNGRTRKRRVSFTAPTVYRGEVLGEGAREFLQHGAGSSPGRPTLLRGLRDLLNHSTDSHTEAQSSTDLSEVTEEAPSDKRPDYVHSHPEILRDSGNLQPAVLGHDALDATTHDFAAAREIESAPDCLKHDYLIELFNSFVSQSDARIAAGLQHEIEQIITLRQRTGLPAPGMKSREPVERALAAYYLRGSTLSPLAISSLEELAIDPNPVVAAVAFDSLWHSADFAGASLAGRVLNLAGSRNTLSRTRVAQFLGARSRNLPAVVSTLRRLLHDDNLIVQRDAAEALGRLPVSYSRRALRQLLKCYLINLAQSGHEFCSGRGSTAARSLHRDVAGAVLMALERVVRALSRERGQALGEIRRLVELVGLLPEHPDLEAELMELLGSRDATVAIGALALVQQYGSEWLRIATRRVLLDQVRCGEHLERVRAALMAALIPLDADGVRVLRAAATSSDSRLRRVAGYALKRCGAAAES